MIKILQIKTLRKGNLEKKPAKEQLKGKIKLIL